MLVSRALGAKEVNSCMGRVVAAPTAGASGILPGTLTTLQELHHLDDRKIHEGLLVAAGIALIIEQNASLALSIADRGYVLQNGAIVLSGRAEDLLDDPAVQQAYLGQRVA